MGKNTGIAYCDSTINPVVGCTGCELYSPDPNKNRCYAAAMMRRYAGLKGWPKSFTQPKFFDGRLDEALRWSDLTGTDRPDKPWLNGMPRVVFLVDMGDIFAPDAPNPLKWLAPRLIDIAASPHIFLVLTKWPRRMVKFFRQVGSIPENVWLGTTITWPETGWRLRELVKLARVGNTKPTLWLSLEPLLGPTDLAQAGNNACVEWFENGGIDWVIVGGESGPSARPMHAEWARSLRDQCQAAEVPFFFKQWGEYVSIPQARDLGVQLSMIEAMNANSIGGGFVRVGKKRAGDLLDGVVWHEFPQL